MNPIHMLDRAARSAGSLASVSHQESLLAAIAVRGDGATVQATNKAVRVKDCTRQWSTHAEVRICRKLDAEAVVFVARVTRDGSWAMARPCPNCLRRLRRQRVRRIYYTIGPGGSGKKGGEYGVLLG